MTGARSALHSPEAGLILPVGAGFGCRHAKEESTRVRTEVRLDSSAVPPPRRYGICGYAGRYWIRGRVHRVQSATRVRLRHYVGGATARRVERVATSGDCALVQAQRCWCAVWASGRPRYEAHRGLDDQRVDPRARFNLVPSPSELLGALAKWRGSSPFRQNPDVLSTQRTCPVPSRRPSRLPTLMGQTRANTRH